MSTSVSDADYSNSMARGLNVLLQPYVLKH